MDWLPCVETIIDVLGAMCIAGALADAAVEHLFAIGYIQPPQHIP